MTALGQSIGIGGDYGTEDIQVLHYGIWTWRRILNRACTSISNLPENIAWQTHKDDLRPEARGLGWSPHLPPSNPASAQTTNQDISKYIQQNSFNLARKGPNRCRIMKYSRLSDTTYNSLHLSGNLLLLLLYFGLYNQQRNLMWFWPCIIINMWK